MSSQYHYKDKSSETCVHFYKTVLEVKMTTLSYKLMNWQENCWSHKSRLYLHRGSLLENVQKAREKRRGETRARAVSRGEVRHELFLMKRQDRDLLQVMQRHHLKVSKSKATWPNHVDKRYKRYEKICSSGQKICEEQGWEQPSKYKVKVHR